MSTKQPSAEGSGKFEEFWNAPHNSYLHHLVSAGYARQIFNARDAEIAELKKNLVEEKELSAGLDGNRIAAEEEIASLQTALDTATRERKPWGEMLESIESELSTLRAAVEAKDKAIGLLLLLENTRDCPDTRAIHVANSALTPTKGNKGNK